MIVNENQLDEWVRANSRSAQGLVVEFVWRLVAASCPNPRERRFPLGDSIGQHGPDGILNAQFSFEPFFPEGWSYWEVGTGSDSHRKATSDYRSLTKAVPKQTRTESTFIFVTPFSGRKDWEYTWQEGAQAKWIDDRRKKGDWKDVRIIDGTKLIDWVHQFLAVELWLAQTISGDPLLHIDIPSRHWRTMNSGEEGLFLKPDLFLINRFEAEAQLKELFDGTTVQLKLTTRYPDQVVDFVSAYLASLDPERRVDINGRCLIVSSVDAWRSICNQPYWKNHILVADSPLDLNSDIGTRLIREARDANHAIVYWGPQGGIPGPAIAPLPMPNKYEIQDALKDAGFGEEHARMLAQKSDGNLSSLLRYLQHLSVLPEWAERSDAAELVIALLLGSWNESSVADRAIVEQLSGDTYGGWIKAMRDIEWRPTTPLIKQESIWNFVPRYEGWYSLGPRLFDDHLERLKAASVAALGERDPQFELPPEERHAASMHGKTMSHSHRLRNGLAETLALLVAIPKHSLRVH